MPLYIDPSLIVATQYIVCATKETLNSLEVIALLLDMHGTIKRVFVDYPNQEQRDKAFLVLSVAMREAEGQEPEGHA